MLINAVFYIQNFFIISNEVGEGEPIITFEFAQKFSNTTCFETFFFIKIFKLAYQFLP